MKAFNDFKQGPDQSDESYSEQKEAILVNIQTIDVNLNILRDRGGTFIKSVGYHGAPGSGKYFITLYCCLYPISNGLKVIATSIMSRRSVHLGGLHNHKLFCLNVNNKMSPQRLAELLFIKCQQNPVKLNTLQTVNIIYLAEAGQMSA